MYLVDDISIYMALRTKYIDTMYLVRGPHSNFLIYALRFPTDPNNKFVTIENVISVKENSYSMATKPNTVFNFEGMCLFTMWARWCNLRWGEAVFRWGEWSSDTQLPPIDTPPSKIILPAQQSFPFGRTLHSASRALITLGLASDSPPWIVARGEARINWGGLCITTQIVYGLI
jgi:hypothetical protein